MPAVTSRLTPWMRLAGLFLLLWGPALAVVHHYGSDLPQYDQWDAEGALIYLPHAQGTLEAQAFFRPHNEHRIALARGLAYLLLLANGQWDARLQCVVNAALHALIGVLAFGWGCKTLATHWRIGWLLVVAGFTALPVSWEIVLSGFGSQQYMLVGCSLGTLALLGAAPAGTGRWWLGVLCAWLALFTMASGLFAAAVVAATLLLFALRERGDWRRHGPTLLVCGAVIVTGLLLHAPAPLHEVLHSDSVGEYVAALRRYLQWPFEGRVWGRLARAWILPVLQWLPWLWLGARLWRQGRESATRERVIWAAAGWALLQFAVSAYARGAGAPKPSSRYVDTLLVGVGANLLALALLCAHTKLAGWRRRVLVGGALVGCVGALAGVGMHVGDNFSRHLPRHRAHLARTLENTRAYLATGDFAHLQHGDIPYPQADTLAEWLSHPEIRAILPASLQPAPARPGPLSRIAAWLARAGIVIAALGAALLAAAAWRDWRQPACVAELATRTPGASG